MNRALLYVALLAALVLAMMLLVLPHPAEAPVGAAPGDGVARPEPLGYPYLETTQGCGPYFEGTCVNLRAGPGTDYPVVMRLRNNMVFRIASSTVRDGQAWYQVAATTSDMLYPERVTSEWWVDGRYVRTFYEAGEEDASQLDASSTKRIVIDISTQTLTAYDGTTTFLRAPISTGLADTPTPLGSFWVMRKVPDAYMQGPIPGFAAQYYDMPGVPWDLYFTPGGSAIHGAYWHNRFGQEWSHGCVNLEPSVAERLYYWADPGTPVVVKR